ncbi:RNA polymerase sigma factor [Kribbella sp. NPDC056861]|uniref:RNA polymerase sigma factor n=1 Tax=Kribbella sp. NPDC056861 TaxID=3154857 RepID=UPI00344013EC
MNGPEQAAALDELAQRAARGEPAALEDLLRRIRPDAVRICQRLLPYPQDAEEAAQDALFRISLKIGTFEGRSRFSTWLYAVASNCARETYRTLRRRSLEATSPVQPDRPDPRTTSVMAGTRLDLLEALERLGQERPEAVAPLVLRDVYSLPYGDIAAELDIPLGTVKSRIHAGRDAIRPYLLPGR